MVGQWVETYKVYAVLDDILLKTILVAGGFPVNVSGMK